MAFSSLFRDGTESLRFHTQGGVELAGQVLESNQGRQFDAMRSSKYIEFSPQASKTIQLPCGVRVCAIRFN
jgi:hypothetical protein